jgi:hypothetical protein
VPSGSKTSSCDPAPIVEQLSSASVLAVVNGRHLVGDLRSIRERWNSQITARRDSAVHRVVDLLIRQPVFDALTLQRNSGSLPAMPVDTSTLSWKPV